MNADATTAIRELTAQELDQVSGGFSHNSGDAYYSTLQVAAVITGAAIGALVGAFFDWLFG